jgi:hypothetical protein
MKTAIDDFPSISVSRMRAFGEITAETKTTTVTFGEVGFNVALALLRFPNGGSWSFFVCPCGRKCRTIRLYEGGLTCRRCLGLGAFVLEWSQYLIDRGANGAAI